MQISLHFVTALLLALILTGCGDKDGHTGEHKDAAPAKAAEEADHADAIKLTAEEIERAGIRTEGLEEQTLAAELVVTATVQANQDAIAHVGPRVPGRLVKIQASIGDTVRAGQTLAVLDSLEVGEAHSAYLQALSEAQLAGTAFERADRLNAEQVIPTKDFQRARAEHEKARSQLAAAGDRLRMLGVKPQATPGGGAVSTFPLVAPQAGVIIEKHAVLGELAKPEESLFTVADLATLWIEADVPEKDLSRVPPGAKATITSPSYPGVLFPGKVAYVGALMDKETRTVRARILVPNADRRLKPEMFVTAAIATGATRKALSVPESAITLLQGLPAVFVEEGAGFEPRPIEIAERNGGRAVIKSGLKAGELVVIEGVYALKARQLKSQIGSGHAH